MVSRAGLSDRGDAVTVVYRVVCLSCGDEMYEGPDRHAAHRYFASQAKRVAAGHDVRLQAAEFEWRDLEEGD